MKLPFPEAEYRARQQRVRAEMAAAGLDLLYITSPANLFYLTGYQAIWYPNRLPLGAVMDDRSLVMFDWVRHVSYTSTRVLCDDAVYFDYGNAIDVVVKAFSSRGWLGRCIGFEWYSLNPSAPLMQALAKELCARSTEVCSGDWLVDRVGLYKSADELDRVRRAAAMADRAMLGLQDLLRPGLTGVQVSAELNRLLAENGSEIAATPPLVNAGPTAWTDVHAFPSHRPLQSGDVISIDCCAVVDRYHANLARTFVLGDPLPRVGEMLAAAGESVSVLLAQAKLGEGPEFALEAAQKYIRKRVPAENIWWIGGYSLGIAMPPGWVGHTYLANDGPEKCRWLPGYVSNYENVFIDPDLGCEAQNIDTLVMTESGLEVLSGLPRKLIEVPV